MIKRRLAAVGLLCMSTFVFGNQDSCAAFSDSEKALKEWYQAGRTVITEITASISPVIQSAGPAAANLWAQVISQPGSFTMNLSENDETMVSLWASKDNVWLSLGNDEAGSDAVCVPLENVQLWEGLSWEDQTPAWSETDQFAVNRLRSIPGIGELAANPAFRFWTETDDGFPLWDMLSRQWARLRLHMGEYSTQSRTTYGMSGIDRPAHCVTYVLTGAQLADTLASWTAGLACDPQMLWLFDAIPMNETERAKYLELFRSAAESLAHMTSGDKLTLRVYFDSGDYICGVTGSATMRSVSGESLPLRVTYRRRTSGSKITYELRLSALPDSKGDGFDLRANIAVTERASGAHSFSVTVRLDTRVNAAMYRLDAAASYTDKASDSYESITGDGKITLTSSGKTAATLSWTHTGTGRGEALPEREDAVAVRYSSKGLVPWLPVSDLDVSAMASRKASPNGLDLPVVSARNLLNMSGELPAELYPP